MNSHFFPGRVRLRFTQLRQSPGRLATLCADLVGVNGVTSVNSRASTGGVLIRYTPGAGAVGRFWDELDTVLLAHHLDHAPLVGARRTSPPPSSGKASVGALAERIGVRLVLGLVAAML